MRPLLAAAFACALLPPAAAQGAEHRYDNLPQCVLTDAHLITRLDSTIAASGDFFTFKIVKAVDPTGNLPAIPAGTIGYGTIDYARRAATNGVVGMLILEPRFALLADSGHVPVAANPAGMKDVQQGSSRNAPGALGFLPFLGLAAGGYNALHKGRDVVLPTGTPFRVVVGDDLAMGRCYVPPESSGG